MNDKLNNNTFGTGEGVNPDRKYHAFNARWLSMISGRTISNETRKPSFDIIVWILWQRDVWLGKTLRDTKGTMVRNILRWNFTRQVRGDMFYHPPSNLRRSSQVLLQHVCDLPGWTEFWYSCTLSNHPHGTSSVRMVDGRQCRRSKWQFSTRKSVPSNGKNCDFSCEDVKNHTGHPHLVIYMCTRMGLLANDKVCGRRSVGFGLMRIRIHLTIWVYVPDCQDHKRSKRWMELSWRQWFVS